MAASPGLSSTWGVTDFSPVLIEALSQEAVLLRSRPNRVLCEGRAVSIPRLLVNPRATWTGELETIRSDAGEADQLVLTPRKLANLIHLSNESVADANVNELDAVGRAMVRGVATALDSAAFSTTRAEAKTPAGLMVETNSIPTVRNRAAVTIRILIESIGTVQAAGGVPSAIVLSAADLTAVRLESLSAAFPLTADPQAPGIERIGGAQLFVAPGFVTKQALIYDSQYLTVAIRRDAAVDFSPDSGFASDATDARVTMRVDYAPSDPRAFVYLLPEA